MTRQFTIVLDVVTGPEGQVCVLPTEASIARLRAAARLADQRGADEPSEDKRRGWKLDAEAAAYNADAQEWVRKQGLSRSEPRHFVLREATQGTYIAADREAKEHNAETGEVAVNVDLRLNALIRQCAVDPKAEELMGLARQVFTALAREFHALNEPDAATLLFLAERGSSDP